MFRANFKEFYNVHPEKDKQKWLEQQQKLPQKNKKRSKRERERDQYSLAPDNKRRLRAPAAGVAGDAPPQSRAASPAVAAAAASGRARGGAPWGGRKR